MNARPSLGGVTMRRLETKKFNSYGLTAKKFEDAVLADIEKGLVPFFVSFDRICKPRTPCGEFGMDNLRKKGQQKGFFPSFLV